MNGKMLSMILGVCLSGCASLAGITMPGTISENVSGFDQTKEISMEPAWLIGGNAIKLGLYKTSRMNADQAMLVAVVRGAYTFSDKESLQFNIDGEKISLDPADSLTNIETKEGLYNSVAYFPAYNESSKRYWINKDFMRKLIDAKKVWVKVNLSREYAEGEFSRDDPYSARPAFREFYKKVWDNESEGKK